MGSSTWHYWNGSRWLEFGQSSTGWSIFGSGTQASGGGGIRDGGVWDGSKWRLTGLQEVFWDGQAWADKLPRPVVYPSLTGSSGDVSSGVYRAVKLPYGMRIDDFVVTVCVADSGSPVLRTPSRRAVYTKRLQNGAVVSVGLFRFDTPAALHDGDSVVWEGVGSGLSTVMNYVYRGAEVTKSPIAAAPVFAEFTGVSQAPLTMPGGNTALFLVVTQSKTEANVKFPTGMNIHGASAGGQLGETLWRIHSCDRPSDKAGSAGNVMFGVTVPVAVVVAVKVPGGEKGKTSDYLPGVTPPAQPEDVPTVTPTPDEGVVIDVKPKPEDDISEPSVTPPKPKVWILGDQTDSVLGQTTILQ